MLLQLSAVVSIMRVLASQKAAIGMLLSAETWTTALTRPCKHCHRRPDYVAGLVDSPTSHPWRAEEAPTVPSATLSVAATPARPAPRAAATAIIVSAKALRHTEASAAIATAGIASLVIVGTAVGPIGTGRFASRTTEGEQSATVCERGSGRNGKGMLGIGTNGRGGNVMAKGSAVPLQEGISTMKMTGTREGGLGAKSMVVHSERIGSTVMSRMSRGVSEPGRRTHPVIGNLYGTWCMVAGLW